MSAFKHVIQVKSTQGGKFNNRMLKALELLDKEHGTCAQNTCSIAHALSVGAGYLALDIFLGSGAASEELLSLGIPRDVLARLAKQERKLLGDTSPCEECGAYRWGGEAWCDSCGR